MDVEWRAINQDFVKSKSDYTKQLEGNISNDYSFIGIIYGTVCLDFAETRQQLTNIKSDYAQEFDGNFLWFHYFKKTIDLK